MTLTHSVVECMIFGLDCVKQAKFLSAQCK